MNKTIILTLLAAFCSGPVAALSPEWVDKWATDLETLSSELPEIHPDPFRSLSQSDFAKELDHLKERLPRLEHHEVVVELARIMALLEDGHTRLTLPLAPGTEFFRGHAKTRAPTTPELLIRQYPLRFEAVDDGFVLTRITKEAPGARALLGARLVAVDGRPLEEALAALRPTIERDNEMGVLYRLPERLVLAEILHARGIVADLDQATWTLETIEGQQIRLSLRPVAIDESVPWLESTLPSRLPAATDVPFELSLLPDGRTAHFFYREVADGAEERIVDLAHRLQRMLDQDDVDRLVIDLRENRGGDNSLSLPLLHALIRSSDLQRPGGLIVLIGRKTFSAAMMFAVDLERHLPVLFLGEPTGSSPNHFGDSQRFVLPNTGLTVRISSRYWQYSHPLDKRPWIEPQILVPRTIADVRAGRNRTMEMVAELGLSPSEQGFAEIWIGDFRYRMHTFPGTLDLAETDGSLQGRIRFAQGLDRDIPLEALRVESDRLYFQLRLPVTFSIEAYRIGDFLIGLAQDRGRGGVFALRRQAATR